MFKIFLELKVAYFRTRLGSCHAITITHHNNIGLGSDALSAEKTSEGCHAPVTKKPIFFFFFHQNSDTLSLLLRSCRCFIPGVYRPEETNVSHCVRKTDCLYPAALPPVKV
jgi:hypothetical protein